MDLRLVAPTRVAGLCRETAQELTDNEASAGSRDDFRRRALWHDGRAGIGYVTFEAFVRLHLKREIPRELTAADSASRRINPWVGAGADRQEKRSSFWV